MRRTGHSCNGGQEMRDARGWSSSATGNLWLTSVRQLCGSAGIVCQQAACPTFGRRPRARTARAGGPTLRMRPQISLGWASPRALLQEGRRWSGRGRVWKDGKQSRWLCNHLDALQPLALQRQHAPSTGLQIGWRQANAVPHTRRDDDCIEQVRDAQLRQYAPEPRVEIRHNLKEPG